MITQRVRLLTPDEERDLGLKAHAGDREARDELVRHNLRLVINLARRYQRPACMEVEDLVQYGMLGLLRAATDFDPDSYSGIRFSTYATYWIRNTINKGLIDEGHMIRVPRYLREAAKRLDAGQEVKAIHRRLVEHYRGIVVDHDAGDEGCMLGEIPDPAPADDALEHREELARVSRAMCTLTPSRRYVLEGRFLEGRKLWELGDELGVSRERIRQIEMAAIEELQGKLGD